MYFFVHNLAFFVLLASAGGVRLLEPIPTPTGIFNTIPSGSGVSVIQKYIAGIWPWLIGIGVGLALLRIVIGGIKIMNSGGNPGERTAAKDEIMWAIAGLLMLIMAGAILAAINPSAYGVV